jgi:hypothetical protein
VAGDDNTFPRERVPDENAFDYGRYRFPSDAVTIRDIRTREPERIDIDVPEFANNDESNSIETLLYLERSIAVAVYSVASGKQATRVVLDQEMLSEHEEELVEEYFFYGLARTTHEARELIKGIKDQARAHARESQGLGPGPDDDGLPGRG